MTPPPTTDPQPHPTTVPTTGHAPETAPATATETAPATTAPERGDARVVLLTGPSGAGKSRLAQRLAARHGWPTVPLDDFYLDGDAPGLPLQPALGIPDWDDPRSWDAAAATRALTDLVRTGRATCPTYDISTSSTVGTREVTAGPRDLVVAEGIFAAELVAPLTAAGLLHSAWCVRRARPVTFALRLTRDLREHRKPPLTLLRRGLALARGERDLVARSAALGACPATPREVERALRAD